MNINKQDEFPRIVGGIGDFSDLDDMELLEEIESINERTVSNEANEEDELELNLDLDESIKEYEDINKDQKLRSNAVKGVKKYLKISVMVVGAALVLTILAGLLSEDSGKEDIGTTKKDGKQVVTTKTLFVYETQTERSEIAEMPVKGKDIYVDALEYEKFIFVEGEHIRYILKGTLRHFGAKIEVPVNTKLYQQLSSTGAIKVTYNIAKVFGEDKLVDVRLIEVIE